MQPFADASNEGQRVNPAPLVIETVLLGIQTIRQQVRSGPSSISVPQFRTLAYINWHGGASLSDLADHLELTLPSTSRAVDYLVKQDMVERSPASDDRRRITLTLTDKGREAFRQTADAVDTHFDKLLDTLSEEDRVRVVEGLTAVRDALLAHRHENRPD